MIRSNSVLRVALISEMGFGLRHGGNNSVRLGAPRTWILEHFLVGSLARNFICFKIIINYVGFF